MPRARQSANGVQTQTISSRVHAFLTHCTLCKSWDSFVGLQVRLPEAGRHATSFERVLVSNSAVK